LNSKPRRGWLHISGLVSVAAALRRASERRLRDWRRRRHCRLQRGKEWRGRGSCARRWCGRGSADVSWCGRCVHAHRCGAVRILVSPQPLETASDGWRNAAEVRFNFDRLAENLRSCRQWLENQRNGHPRTLLPLAHVGLNKSVRGCVSLMCRKHLSSCMPAQRSWPSLKRA